MLAVLLSLLSACHPLSQGLTAQDFQLSLFSNAKVNQYPQTFISFDGELMKNLSLICI